MTLDYFYGQAGELFAFYRIPKALFQEPRFQSLSTDAKTLYGILLDRMSLSVKNGWLDEQNRVFIIFSIEDVKRALCCADNKATKLLRELEKFGLIERKRRGLGKPSLVYVKNFSAESSKSIFQNRDFHDSGGFKNASQDPSKSRCNKTKENDTEMSETDPFYSEEADGMSKRTQLEEYFSQSLEIDLLLRLCPDDEDTIYQIVDLLVDTCATNRKLLHIAGDDLVIERVFFDILPAVRRFGDLRREAAHEGDAEIAVAAGVVKMTVGVERNAHGLSAEALGVSAQILRRVAGVDHRALALSGDEIGGRAVVENRPSVLLKQLGCERHKAMFLRFFQLISATRQQETKWRGSTSTSSCGS